MWIVAIAWIYVVGLMAVTETSIVAGVMTFVGYCAIPLSILHYLMGGKRRRARRELSDSDDSGTGSDIVASTFDSELGGSYDSPSASGDDSKCSVSDDSNGSSCSDSDSSSDSSSDSGGDSSSD